MEDGVGDLGLMIQCLGFWVYAFEIECKGFRAEGLGFRVQGLGFRVQGLGFRVEGSGFRVQGLRFMIWGVGLTTRGAARSRATSTCHQGVERLVIYCKTTSVSATPATHCATKG